MKAMEVRIVNLKDKDIYGIWTKSNDKTMSDDISEISKKFYALTNQQKGKVLPFYVLCRNHNPKTGNMQLFVGCEQKYQTLDHLTLSSADYAIIEVGPKLGIFWSSNIQKAKSYFYDEWLKDSAYESLNMHYEYHSFKSKDKHPTIEIIFAINPR